MGALLVASTASAQVLYVDANLNTGANDGSSWADAYQGISGLQTALNAVTPSEDIYVAQGTYVPAAVGSRGISFLLRPGTGVYGGFVGGESHPDERPPFGDAPTILSGDLAQDDSGTANQGENSYHVVRTNGATVTSILDGFVVTAGVSNGSGANRDRGGGILSVNGEAPLIRNCEFVGNRCVFGGGAGYINGAAPRFVDVVFRDNSGGSFGGAFDIATGGPVVYDRCTFVGNTAQRAGALEIFSTNGVTVTNCLFHDNTSTSGTGGGGAIWLGSGSNVTVAGCTIVGNTSTNQAQGGIRVQSATLNLRNSVLWDNEGPGGAQAANNQCTPNQNVSWCLVEGTYATGTGNLAADPLFVDAANDDYRLMDTSPAIDAGNNSAVPATSLADRDGAARRFDSPTVADTGNGSAPIVDMGAFEWTTDIGTIVTVCVPNANSTGQPGEIRATGSTSVAANDVTLLATSLPQNAAGFFITSRRTGFVPNPAGSGGNLCLHGSIGRYVGPGQVLNSGSAGEFSLTIDLTTVPQPMGSIMAMAGDSWAYQAWHRDSQLGIPTSNFTNAIRVRYE